MVGEIDLKCRLGRLAGVVPFLESGPLHCPELDFTTFTTLEIFPNHDNCESVISCDHRYAEMERFKV